MLGKSIGAAAGVGVQLWLAELRLRAIIGAVPGLWVDGSLVLFRDSLISPRIGGRFTALFGAGFGGGPQGGVRVRLAFGFSLNAEVAFELYAINPAYSPRALVLGAGLSWDALSL